MTAPLKPATPDIRPRIRGRRPDRARGVLRRASRTIKGRIGLALTLFVVLVALAGPYVSPYSPTEFVGLPFGPPTHDYLLGTDVLGRDVLSRVLNGGTEVLMVAAAATALAVVAGLAIGATAAYVGGWLDGLLMRLVDVFLSFPQLVFVLLVVSVLGPKTWLLILAVAISQAPAVARVMRSVAVEVSERDFVRAAKLWRPGRLRIIAGEIVPNLTSPLMVESGLRLTWSVSVIASLSFLGLGLPPPNPNWGLMISENLPGINADVYAVLVPALLLGALAVGLNMFTDAIATAALHGDTLVLELKSQVDQP